MATRWQIDSDYVEDEMLAYFIEHWGGNAQSLGVQLNITTNIVYQTDNQGGNENGNENGGNSDLDLNQLFLLFTITCVSFFAIITVISWIDKIYNHNELLELGSLVLFLTYLLDFFSGIYTIYYILCTIHITNDKQF